MSAAQQPSSSDRSARAHVDEQEQAAAPTAQRDIVVVGASAGGVEALAKLVADLPPELPAAVFVVLHILAAGRSMLHEILTRAGELPAAPARDGEPIRRGEISIAPPDHHLVLHRDLVRLSRGPRENGHRPAIDPLFRSAARSYGARVIGVVLSGLLDDGAAGLRFIKEHGGAAIVQDVSDSLYSGMPLAAQAATEVDRVVPIRDMASSICDLIDEPLPDSAEVEAAGGETDQIADQVELDPTIAALVEGPPSALTCPECGGALWETHDGPVVRFTCQVGHAYSADSLVNEQGRALEGALWSGLRALEERADLLRRLSRRAAGDARGRFAHRAREAEEQASQLRDTLLRIGRSAVEATAAGEPETEP